MDPHTKLIIGIFLILLLCPSRATASGVELLSTRPEQSLRGEKIDLDDEWSSARLLAHFGENELGYRALRRRAPSVALDMQVERFEARLLAEMGRHRQADSLLAFQSYTGDLDLYYLLCIRRARLNLEAGRYARAITFVGLIDTISSPAYGPYADLIAMQALTNLGNYEEAYLRGETRLEQGIPLSLSPTFEEELFRAYVDAGKLEKAVKFTTLLRARKSGVRAFAPLFVQEVGLWFDLGDSARAVQSCLALLRDVGIRSQSADAVKMVMQHMAAQKLPTDALLEFTDVLLSGGVLDEADRAIEALAKRQLKGDDAERALLYRAMLYYEERRYSRAFDLIQKPLTNKASERDAALLRARIYRKTENPTRAANAYAEFATQYPYDSVAPEALFVAADLYLRANDRTKMMDVLNRIVETYPSHRYSRLATMKMASYYVERRHLSRAVAILERALERTGRRSEELLYHLAGAYGRMGKLERKEKLLGELASLNPISFYIEPEVPTKYRQPIIDSNGRVAMHGDQGLLRFLKTVFDRRAEATDTIRRALEPLPAESRTLEAGAVYLERGRQFLLMGFRDWGERELQQLESGPLSARIWFELGVLYDDFSMHWKSVRAFQRVYYSLEPDKRHELEGSFRLLMYPVPYPSLVFENCARYGIAPHLVYAMMRQESFFDSNAISRAGAVGLMQLMPATGDEVASRLGVPEGVQQNLFAPEINLTFGIWYASHLLSRSADNPVMMLAAYNAGLGNARRWFSSTDRSPESLIDHVEGVDYRETRSYIKNIVESAHVYHTYYFASTRTSRGGSR